MRIVSLEIVNNAVQTQTLELRSLCHVRDSLMGYIQQRYTIGSMGPDSPVIQNKLTQTLTYLFKSLYASEWTSFFADFQRLAGDDDDAGSANPRATMLYLRLVGSIHDEIADVMIRRTAEEQKRGNELKDLIRERDAQKIAFTWQKILARWQVFDLSIVELCLRTIAKWVSWIDISLVIDRSIQTALLQLAGQSGPSAGGSLEGRVRDAAIDTFTETVNKKMGVNDKIELIHYLNLSDIVRQLIASPALSDSRGTPQYDTDLAEAVAKLVNSVFYDIVRALDTDGIEAQTIANANNLLQLFLPFLLRFFSDEYDEVCSAVIPSLTDLLGMQRRHVKSKGGPSSAHLDMLRPILDAIIMKMKYDETATWGEEAEATDEADFQELRKRLYVLQQTIAAIDETLYIETISHVIVSTLTRLDSPEGRPNWRDLDLALHEMYLFGELAVKNGGLYQKSNPSSEASRRLLEMVSKMIESRLASHPHPAVQLQYMEICVRYVQFFEHNPDSVPKVLECFVGLVHSTHPKVRLRSWYLFHRFVRHLRALLGNLAQTVLQAVGDLLTIRAEIRRESNDEDISSDDNGQSSEVAFTSQLYLFEAIGCVASTNAVPVETRVMIASSIIRPLIADLDRNLQAAVNGDATSTLQVHHVIMALGTLANGFFDCMASTSGASAGSYSRAVSQEFVPASEAVLSALEALNRSSEVNNAARHAFSRFLGVIGTDALPQLPRWIDGLLTAAGHTDEMAMFLRTLGQVVHAFKSDMSSMMDRLLSPVFDLVFVHLGKLTSGTDDEIQLRELKQQYLNFVLYILNNDLASTLVSPGNQVKFESFILSLTRCAVDPIDPYSARLAFSALARMSSIFGGPDIAPQEQPTPTVPGFDGFMLSRFSPLPWSFLAAPGFNAGDAQIRSAMQEAAGLQWTMFRKAGASYESQLGNELRGLGAGEEGVTEFLRHLKGDAAGFRRFFVGFVQSAKR